MNLSTVIFDGDDTFEWNRPGRSTPGAGNCALERKPDDHRCPPDAVYLDALARQVLGEPTHIVLDRLGHGTRQ